MGVQFAVLASGSRGNATLVRAGGSGLLIDLGVGPRILTERLESVGARWDQVGSAVLTHTHGDHVDDNTLGLFARRGISLYCHERHRRRLGSLVGFQTLDAAGLVRHYDDRPFLTPGGVGIEPLELSHDGATFGFRIEIKADRKSRSVAIGYVADTGTWSPALADGLSGVDLLGVEFNHDVELQRQSPRSAALIARNLGPYGHLSNVQGADFVAAVLKCSERKSLRHLVLLHISLQCNRPLLALKSARAAIRGSGRRIAIHAAQQAPAHPNLWVEPGRRSRLPAALRRDDPADDAALPF